MGIFTKGINKYAYRGKLTCPVCDSTAIRFVEDIGRFRKRYRCRKCGVPFQYDISNASPGMDGGSHPYAPLKKNKFQQIVDLHNQIKTGRTKKGR